MAQKKKAKAAARKPVKKVVKKKPVKKAVKRVVKKEVAAPHRPVTALECQVCGYRLIVDRKCGCAEEHMLVCCGQPMQKVETTI
ncbi:MAG: hypothetical protein NUW07_11405 [Candidatus Saccharicenans sp.]|jgi:hypothetical protein|nr:hypothetical protein [Candidatus Saccharicenans sp.]